MLKLLILLAMYVTVGSGTYDDSHPGLYYAGNWSYDTAATAQRAYESTLATAQDATASVSFSFVGQSLAIIVYKDAGYGTAEICIDEDCITGDWSAAAGFRTDLLTAENLGDGQHTVTITANGDGFITLDAVVIGQTVNTEAETTPEPETGATIALGDGYAGTVEYSASAGEIAIIILVTMLVVFVGASFVMQSIAKDED